MNGQGLLPEQHHPLVDLHSDAEVLEYLEHTYEVVRACAEAMPDHARFIAEHCASPMS